MRHFVFAVVVAVLGASQANSAEPASYSPAALVSRQTGGHIENVISVFPAGRKAFQIPLPLITRWFAYGKSGKAVYTTALKEISPRSFTNVRGLFKIELEPMRAVAIPGLDAFDSIGPLAVSQNEDFVVFSGAKGGYMTRSCGVYRVDLPDRSIRAILETSECLAGSPWRVLDVSPNGTEAMISVDRRLALLDLSQGSIMKLEGQLSNGSFSPDGKWIAALQVNNPDPARTILIDRTDLAKRRDLGSASNGETAWSPDSKFLLQTVYRPACPSQNPLALETVAVQTGNRSTIKNSICECCAGDHIGWIRSDVKR
jgi:hypothetical protein